MIINDYDGVLAVLTEEDRVAQPPRASAISDTYRYGTATAHSHHRGGN